MHTTSGTNSPREGTASRRKRRQSMAPSAFLLPSNDAASDAAASPPPPDRAAKKPMAACIISPFPSTSKKRMVASISPRAAPKSSIKKVRSTSNFPPPPPQRKSVSFAAKAKKFPFTDTQYFEKKKTDLEVRKRLEGNAKAWHSSKLKHEMMKATADDFIKIRYGGETFDFVSDPSDTTEFLEGLRDALGRGWEQVTFNGGAAPTAHYGCTVAKCRESPFGLERDGKTVYPPWSSAGFQFLFQVAVDFQAACREHGHSFSIETLREHLFEEYAAPKHCFGGEFLEFFVGKFADYLAGVPPSSSDDAPESSSFDDAAPGTTNTRAIRESSSFSSNDDEVPPDAAHASTNARAAVTDKDAAAAAAPTTKHPPALGPDAAPDTTTAAAAAPTTDHCAAVGPSSFTNSGAAAAVANPTTGRAALEPSQAQGPSSAPSTQDLSSILGNFMSVSATATAQTNKTLNDFIGASQQQFSLVNKRVDGVEARQDQEEERLDGVEDELRQETAARNHDVGRLDGRIDTVHGRVDGMESRQDGLEARQGQGEARQDGLEARQDQGEARQDGWEARLVAVEESVRKSVRKSTLNVDNPQQLSIALFDDSVPNFKTTLSILQVDIVEASLAKLDPKVFAKKKEDVWARRTLT